MDFYADIASSDTLRPSLFELVAQEQLRDLLQPAVKYVLAVFAQRYPRYLLRIVSRHEEFYALLMLLVERHYLKEEGASFSENFYGLKRRRTPAFETERANAIVGTAPEYEKLRRRDARLSLLLLVGVPYIRAKLQDWYEQLGGGLDADLVEAEASRRRQVQPQTSRARLISIMKQLFKTAYPWVNAAFELWLFGYNVAYLFNKTPYYRPWLAWIGVDLRRMSMEDFREAQTRTVKPREAHKYFLIRMLSLLRPSSLLSSLKQLLPLSLLALKFLEWWYSPASPARFLTRTSQGPPIPPPAPLYPHPKGVGVDREKYGQCPVCKGEIVNATALPTGWVCCYACAVGWVREKGTCPVTRLKVRVEELRKILV